MVFGKYKSYKKVKMQKFWKRCVYNLENANVINVGFWICKSYEYSECNIENAKAIKLVWFKKYKSYKRVVFRKCKSN